MFNPLAAFEPGFLARFIKKGVKAFVRQTYSRGKDSRDGSAEAFVLIHFEDELAAKQYFDVIKNDPNRRLYKMSDPVHQEAIQQLINTAPVFTMLKVKDAELKARKILDKKLRAFLEYKLQWQPRGSDAVNFTLDVQFGEVYAKLKFRSNEIKVKLAEIENASYVL